MRNNNPAVQAALVSVRHHIWLALLLALSIVGSVILALLPPLILRDMVDGLTAHTAIRASQIASYVALLVCANLAASAKNALISIFGQKVTHELRTTLADKLNRLPSSYFVTAESGGLTSLFVNDVDTVHTLFDEGVVSMITDLCSLAGILIVVFSFSRGLGIVLLIALPLMYLYTRHCQKAMLAAQKDYRRAVADVSQQIPDTIKNRRAIRVYQCQQYMDRRYDQAIDRSFQAKERTSFYDSIYSPVVLVTSALVTAVVMILAVQGGKWAPFFGMSAGTGTAVISYISQIFTPLESLGMEIQNIQSAAAGISRIRSFLALPEEQRDDSLKPDFRQKPVQVEHIDFAYEAAHPIFRDFSLAVETGSMVTLVGRTGAGKSTLFRLVLGLYEPQKGSVRVYGMAPKNIAEKDRRHIYGYVEQQFHAVRGTIRDQVTMLDPEVKEEEVIEALRQTGLYEVVAKLPAGLDTPWTSSVLSQGQFQLLSIARAIVLDPKLLLLDEITANLDAITEEQVLAAVKNACRDRTVLSISHRLYENLGGQIVEIGPSADGAVNAEKTQEQAT